MATPISAYALRVLAPLRPDDIEELSKWNLNKPVTEAILTRLANELQEDRQTAEEVLGRVLRLDLWADPEPRYAAWAKEYEQADDGAKEATQLRRRGSSANHEEYLLHSLPFTWEPEQQLLSGLVIEHNRAAAMYQGSLVVAERAFNTTLDLLETSMAREWCGWQQLWRWY